MLRTLGQLSAGGGHFTRPQGLLLLAYLALEGTRPRQELRALFWPGHPEAAAHLRVTLARLKQGLPGAILTQGETVATTVVADAALLLRAHERGDHPAVVEQFTGAFLDGVALPLLGAALEEWVFATREAIGSCVREALLHLAAREAGRGAFGEAARLAHRAYVLRGAPEPTLPELQRLHDLLLAADHPAARDVRAETRGFDVPLAPTALAARQVWQAPRAPPAAHLPARPTPVVGREAERERVLALLREAPERCIVLTGPGGIGKTHLALDLAHELGVDARLVDLARAHTSGDATGRVDAALAPPGQPELLLLDNLEDLEDPAALVAALLARDPRWRLLVTSRSRLAGPSVHEVHLEGLDHRHPRAGGLTDAATLFMRRARWSRSAPAPDPAGVERIVRLLHGHPLAVELAAGWSAALPAGDLAEALAGDLRLLDEHAPPGTTTPRVVFSRSWARLPPVLQGALAGLAPFEGGFGREAAAEVCGTTLAQLAALCDRALLRGVGAGRFDFHPLLGTYAREALEADGPRWQEVRERHRRHFMHGLAARTLGEADFGNARAAWQATCEAADTGGLREASPGLRFLAGRARRLAEGADLLRRALEVAGAADDREALGELGTDLAWLHLQLGHLDAALGLARAGAGAGGPVRPRALHVLAAVLQALGRPQEARDHWQVLLDLARTNGDEALRLRTLESLAILDEQLGQPGAAERAYLEVLARRRQTRGPGLARALLNYGALLSNLDRLPEARRILDEGCRWARDEEPSLLPWLLTALSEVARKQGEVREALAWCASALDLAGSDAPPALHGLLLDVRARAHLAGGALPAAARDAWQSLDESWRTGALGETLDRLALAASVLAQAGETQQARHLRSRLLREPALPHWTRATLERELGEAAPTPDEAGTVGDVGTLVVEALHQLSAWTGHLAPS
ncbi:hypothetical protein Dcar01_02595 [Deinococcus carri]|uniref:AAA+ ATPase domain-containing protein n=1 Tax=Deinococcus carri TaxID=1211323 RepID=A0ABP9WC95_9DEIO